MSTAALIPIAKIWQQPKCPLADEWTTQLWCIYYSGILFNHKKKEILPFATTWMDLEDIVLNEIIQIEKDKYFMILLICGM